MLEINVDSLSAGGNDALDDRLIKIIDLEHDNIALVHIAVQEITLKHEIVLVDKRRIHRAAVHRNETEEKRKQDRHNRQQIDHIMQERQRFPAALRFLCVLRSSFVLLRLQVLPLFIHG